MNEIKINKGDLDSIRSKAISLYVNLDKGCLDEHQIIAYAWIESILGCLKSKGIEIKLDFERELCDNGSIDSYTNL